LKLWILSKEIINNNHYTHRTRPTKKIRLNPSNPFNPWSYPPSKAI